MKQFTLLFLFLFSLLLSIHASYFKSYQVEDGLSHNCVWAVMQDSRGFMWFGTNDGLNRFDGKIFKIYRKQQGDPFSIGNNFIHCLKEDSYGRLLIGTKQGLYLYSKDFDNFRHIILNKDLSKDATINSIMEDTNGNIWLASLGNGLYELNPDLTVKINYLNNNKVNSLSSNDIWSITKDNNGDIWLGTVGKGLIHFDTKTKKFTNLIDDKVLKITDSTIFSLFCDLDNNIWIGTSTSGLCRYNIRSKKVAYFMRNKVLNIKSIIEYSDHELIMGSDKGLVKFDRIKGVYDLINNQSTFDNLTDKSIFSIVSDREGAFWIGTYFGGVNYLSPSINKFLYYNNSPTNSLKKNIVSSFAEDLDGKIWVGTHNNGLYLFNPKNLNFDKAKQNIGYDNIQSLLLENEKLYISLYGKGVSILNTKNDQSYIFLKGNQDAISQNNNFITFIFKTSKGNVLFCSDEGVNYIEPNSKRLKRIDQLIGKQIKDVKEDYNGSLWFATHLYGLCRMTSNGKWDSFVNNPKDSKSLVNDNVNCIYEDSKFRIWVGTEGGGLTLFNEKKNCFELVFNEESGLPSNIIYSILDDTDGNLWVATSGGLAKINSDLKTVKTFGYLEDMLKIRFNLKCALRASDNSLYFGGTNGFIMFNPKYITSNLKKPLIEISAFMLFNKEVNPLTNSSPLSISISETKKIILEHDQSTFSFEFAVLSYLSPSHNRYAYKLEGFDKDWNYTTYNRASYTNIQAGQYKFIVKGTNNDGVWSDESSIIIKVKPPFWLSSIMIVLYILLIIYILRYLFIMNNKRQNAKNEEKIFKYKTEKEKEIYESKINFFTNIAHEIRTPLSLIIAPLEIIIKSDDGDRQTKVNLKIIDKNANRLLELVNQLLDFRKIEEDMFHFNFRTQNIVKILRNVYDQYSMNAQLNNINILISIENEDVKCHIDSEAIYKIISNLISNAIKYAKSQIEIRVETINDFILLSVIDDGIGLEKIYLEKIFEPFFQVQDNNKVLSMGSGLGLSLSQSLANKQGGLISVKSEHGKGCFFTLKIPLAKDELSIHQEIPNETNNSIPKSNQFQISEIGLRILLVEDNNELRTFLSNNLFENYAVFEAENGLKALKIVENENIDIIVSDIIMPEMNGIELCNILKTDIAYSHIPIILLSAKTDTITKIEGLKMGAEAYLEKPFSVEQLKAQISSIIDNRNNIRNNFIQSPLQYFKQNTENNVNAEFIERLNGIILENMSDEKFSIENLSETFFMSRSNFHKKIKHITGKTPNDYIKFIILNQSVQMLLTGKYKINEVCYLVGFNTPSYFSKCFYEQFGKLPKDYIQTISGSD
jgi:signal transduction histidine kinase/ligand-binding sensor domain-containing protein/DNA-binding NarL/FixJ family response regulator